MGTARRIGGGIIGLRWKGDARGIGLIGKNGKYEKYGTYGTHRTFGICAPFRRHRIYLVCETEAYLCNA